MEDILLPLTAVLSFSASLFYSCAENAQLAVTPHRLEDRLPDKRPQEIEALLANRPRDHLHCLILSLLWNALFVLSVAGMVRAWSLGLAVGVTLAATLVFPIFIGRVFTQAWAGRQAEAVFLATKPIIRTSSLIFGWLTWPLAQLLTWLGRAFELPGVLDRPFTLPEDLFGTVVDVKDQGTIPEEQREMIEGIIELRDANVEEIMTPRTDMLSIAVDCNLDSAIHQVIEGGHYSRVPVYEEDQDHIVGVLYLKDLLRHWSDGGGRQVSIQDLMRQPVFIPETKRIEDLLREFQQKRVHIAIVLDEYGGTSGLVTIEDILEEIVGEIEDEHDQNDELQLHPASTGIYIADARVEIKTLENAIGDFVDEDEREDIDTLGGLVFALAGRVPIRGELVVHPSGIEFEVLDADPRRIRRLRVRSCGSAKPST